MGIKILNKAQGTIARSLRPSYGFFASQYFPPNGFDVSIIMILLCDYYISMPYAPGHDNIITIITIMTSGKW